MSVVKSPYDPIKAVEGMFNGSVTRIAYALKDPVGYSASTRTILTQCAKKFHDALDDCEVQLLDSKWYLENQLKINQARRKALAKETVAATKRKHDEVYEDSEIEVNDEAVSKKVKMQEESELRSSHIKPKAKETITESESEQDTVTKSTHVSETNTQQESTTEKALEKNKLAPDNQGAQQAQPMSKPTEQSKRSANEQTLHDEFANPTPHATPAATNDEDLFESMFVDAVPDNFADDDKDDDETDFDFVSGNFDASHEVDNQDPSSLDALLPGIGGYANQTDDSQLNSNMAVATNNSNNDNNDKNNNDIKINNNVNTKDSNSISEISNNFDLPNLGGPNIFDDFLNDDSLENIDAGGGDSNFDMSDSALFDSFGGFK